MTTPDLIIVPKALVDRRDWRREHRDGASSCTAVIRWQADADGRWEIETLHRGFRHLETAAVFAAGGGAESPAQLDLAPTGDAVLVFPNGLTSSSRSTSRVFEIDEASDVGREREDLTGAHLASFLDKRRSFTRVHGYVVGPDGAVFDVSIRDRGPGVAAAVELWHCSAEVA